MGSSGDVGYMSRGEGVGKNERKMPTGFVWKAQSAKSKKEKARGGGVIMRIKKNMTERREKWRQKKND